MDALNSSAEDFLLNLNGGALELFWEIHLPTRQATVRRDAKLPEWEGKTMPYDELYRHYAKKNILLSERGTWRRLLSLDAMNACFAGGDKQKRFYIRATAVNGGFKWYEVFYCFINETTVYLLCRNADEFRRAQIVSAAVQKEYDYVIYIDARQNSYVLYMGNTSADINIPTTFGDDYEYAMENFNRQNVVLEQREEITEKMRIASVLAALNENDEYELYCRAVNSGRMFDRKLRFTYLDRKEQIILLTRINITNIKEQQRKSQRLEQTLRETVMENQAKRLRHFEEIPIPFCIMRVELNEDKTPKDFVFTYLNQAYAALEKKSIQTLLNRSFSDIFHRADKKWLDISQKTAYLGEKQHFVDYRPEIDRYLEIDMYQPEYAHCACVVRDVTREFLMDIEIEKQRERDMLLLRNTTDAIFQYDLEERTIYNQVDTVHKIEKLGIIPDVPQGLFWRGLILEEGIAAIEDVVAAIENGESEASCEVMARLTKNSNFAWYNICFSAYNEVHTNKRRVIGFLKNVNSMVVQRERLEKAASLDSLTGVYNLFAGRLRVEDALLEQDDCRIKNAFFMFDVDNFKRINDHHGHAFGDMILQQFAAVLRRVFSSENVVFRHGGDEFAAFVTHISGRRQVAAICEKIFKELKLAADTGILISTSIGALIGDSTLSYKEYYHRADALLYQVKSKGKGSYLIDEQDDKNTI